MVVHGGGGRVDFKVSDAVRFVILWGAEFTEPTVVEGSLIMNDQAHIEEAITRSGRGHGTDRFTQAEGLSG